MIETQNTVAALPEPVAPTVGRSQRAQPAVVDIAAEIPLQQVETKAEISESAKTIESGKTKPPRHERPALRPAQAEAEVELVQVETKA